VNLNIYRKGNEKGYDIILIPESDFNKKLNFRKERFKTGKKLNDEELKRFDDYKKDNEDVLYVEVKGTRSEGRVLISDSQYEEFNIKEDGNENNLLLIVNNIFSGKISMLSTYLGNKIRNNLGAFIIKPDYNYKIPFNSDDNKKIKEDSRNVEEIL